jgi:AmmeMemoRadiSam system protein B
MYSGATAAAAYKLLKGRSYKTVVMISPSHVEYFNGISMFGGKGYRTPLGIVEVDGKLRDELRSNNGVLMESDFGHRVYGMGRPGEHALEVQLPFLQKVLEDFRFLPIVMGDQRHEYCVFLGELLGRVLEGKDALIVASSDLSHFYSAEIAAGLDGLVVEVVNNLDPAQLLSNLESRRCEACGGGPIAAMMIAAKKLGATNAEVLHYCTSGDVTGDKEEVVGYLSAAVWKGVG